MKLYGMLGSTCTRRALMTFGEKGVEPELITIDLSKGEHKTPEFSKLQPFGVIPVLDDDGFMLYESRAIMRYLDQRLSGPSLTPQETQKRGRMEQWISIEQSYLSEPTLRILKQTIWNRGNTRDENVIATAKSEVSRTLEVLDHALVSQDYLMGKEFSLADITFMPYLGYLFAAQFGNLIQERKHVSAWWNRISERPSWQKISR